MSEQYRLIWFQHFHKAGGTSIVDMAKINGEKLWPINCNGNPLGRNDELIKLWEYDGNDLTAFIDECETLEVTFIATEWGLPSLDIIKSDSRVTLITCLRSPLNRYVSNFYFDLHNGFTPARSLKNYEATRGRTITMFNYFCRILSNHQNALQEVSQEQYEFALEQLEKFDVCVCLEEGLMSLSIALGWKEQSLHSNRMKFNFKQLVKLVFRGKLKLAYLRLKYPKELPKKEFQDYFNTQNEWDLKLYEGIKKIK